MYTIEEFDKQKSKVMNYILYKKRTEQETRKKFEKIIDIELLDDILEYVKEAGYLNDRAYIEKVIQEYKQLKNLSIKEIEYKLISKGIRKKDLDDYIVEHKEELIEYEIKSAYNILIKKNNMEENDIINYLQRKGYMFDNIKEAIEKIRKLKMKRK